MKLLSKFFSVSPATIQFLYRDKKLYLRKLLVILPITLWATLFYQLTPLFLKWSVDILTNMEPVIHIGSFQYSFSSVLMAIIVLAGILLAMSLLDVILKFWQQILIYRMDFDLIHAQEDRFTDYLGYFDGAFLESENHMRLSTHIHMKLGTLGNQLTDFIVKLIKIPVGLLALVVVLQLMHTYLLLLIVVVVVVNLVFESYQKVVWRRYELAIGRLEEQKNRIKGWIIFMFARATSNGWLAQLWGVYSDKRNKFADHKVQQAHAQYKIRLVADIFNTFSRFAAICLAGWMIIMGKITLGSFAVFDVYMQRFKSMLEEANGVIQIFFMLRYELFRLDFILNMRPKINRADISDAAIPDVDSISIDNLSFTYPNFYEQEKAYFDDMKARLHMLTGAHKAKNRVEHVILTLKRRSFSIPGKRRMLEEIEEIDKLLQVAEQADPVLLGISHTFKRGKIYGLVGYNGAGKTTLTKLLKRGVDPSAGQIHIGSRNLQTISPEAWRRQISSVQQDSLIWPSMSVRDNLMLGFADQDRLYADEEIWTALEKVGLKDSIKSLDAIIGENIQLSGGEKQLLELARILLEQKPLVILDEGTTQLDPIKESRVIALLNEIKKKSIVLFITHRMTTAAKCDEILVLRNGVLETSGTHKSLLDDPKGNLYKEFWTLQTSSRGDIDITE